MKSVGQVAHKTLVSKNVIKVKTFQFKAFSLSSTFTLLRGSHLNPQLCYLFMVKIWYQIFHAFQNIMQNSDAWTCKEEVWQSALVSLLEMFFYPIFFINPESFPEGTLQQGLFLKGPKFGCQMHFTWLTQILLSDKLTRV